MMVNYEYYRDVYGGTKIPEEGWKNIERKMCAKLYAYTFDRLRGIEWPEEAKDALCDMCECAYGYAERDHKASESIDGYSVSFDISKTCDAALYAIASVYLSRSGLMDQGVYADAD